MEVSNAENRDEIISETVVSKHEAVTPEPITTENVDNNQAVTSENSDSTSIQVLEDVNSTNEQLNAEAHNTHSDTNQENVGYESHEVTDETKMENTEVNKSENGAVAEQPETVTETTTITEKYQYSSVTQYEGGDGQSTEYVSQYVLEATRNDVYTSEVQNENLNKTDNVNSETVPEDVQVTDVSDELNQQNTTVPTDPNEQESNQPIIEFPTDQTTTENWPDSEPVPDDEFDESCPKQERRTPDIQSNVDIVDLGNENVVEDENVTSNQENLNEIPVESNVNENVEEPPEVSDVKQETSTVEAEEIDSVRIEELETPNQNEPPVNEQVDYPTNEIIENVDIPNETAVSAENISGESYAIAEGMEISDGMEVIEGSDVTEIQEGEYTIVEGPSSLDITTNRLDESGNSEETWVLLSNNENSGDDQSESVTDEQNEMYLNELRSEAESRQSVTSQASTESKPRRGRKPTYEIPMHVLGHDISKPMEAIPNGRSMPKPRLGVKVPYRNLTSQIVTKAEIEKEVMDRARSRQDQGKSRADIIFARRLTQRLARKIAPSPDPPNKVLATRTSRDTQRKEIEQVVEETTEAENDLTRDNTKIHNDSDLLAILEGEGDEMPVLPKEVPQPQVDDSNLKMLEREIALQQLQDLPHQAPKHRIYRGNRIKVEGTAPVLTPEATPAKSRNNPETGRQESPNARNATSGKENETTKQTATASPRRDQRSAETATSPRKTPVEIEPQVKVNMVLKTYSRKRKTIEMPESMMESPLPKKMLSESEIKTEKPEVPAQPNVYVTKSSRVIKKKVIWDPDEAPSRSPKPVSRIDVPSPKTTVKTAKPVEIQHPEKAAEKKTVTEKPQKEKIEKKPTEKITNKKVVTPIEKKVVTPKSEAAKSKVVAVKGKKLRSEVDKLLMDEGAVKMLYDLKNNEDIAPRKKKAVYSVEKAHKDIMKKANEIKSDLQQNTSNESPKSLRKKETFTPSPVKPAQIIYNAERKMSKDSTRSSVHTPPGSPAYSFPHAQSSMLVRRRSSSSISSSEEVEGNDTSRTSRKKPAAASDAPKAKKIKKSEPSEEAEKSSEAKVSVEKPAVAEKKLFSYNSFTVKKISKHITIDLNYVDEKCYCTGEVLGELTDSLKRFAKEKDCHVVSITSGSKAFCLGLDYASLVSDKEEERKENATQLAEKVRDFLLCLLKFPKVLIAGIQGDCVGLGVTMLPLFDMVIASDTATFSTPYANLGCVAEAGFLLSPPIFTNHGLAAELLYNPQKLTADEAFRRGLVTRLCWPEKYNETLKNIVVSVSKGSKQSLVATKKQLRRHLVQTTEASINSETKVLVEHWTSAECQKNFARINEGTAE